MSLYWHTSLGKVLVDNLISSNILTFAQYFAPERVLIYMATMAATIANLL